jgi:hypothetical protein
MGGLFIYGTHALIIGVMRLAHRNRHIKDRAT